MSTVVPNGQIRFFSDVRLDDNYENSINFETREAQTNYFTSLTPVHVMTGATRVREGVISVNALSDVLLNCNYMMFQNTGFSNKWFYAFIHNVEYVNNNMSYVYYTIDDMQTWGLFDVTLEQCFIEREHTRTDGLFEHLINENIDVGEYVNSDLITNELDLTGYDALLYYYGQWTDEFHPRITATDIMPKYGNLNGVNCQRYTVQDNDGNWLPIRYTDPDDPDHPIDTWNGMELLNITIKMLFTDSNLSNNILGIYLIPKKLLALEGDYQDDKYAKTIEFNLQNFNTTSLLDGYSPKNKKLYTSPFCNIQLGLSDGQTINLQPEYISDNTPHADVLIDISTTPTFMVVPRYYKNDNYSWDKAITFDAIPQMAVAIDGYKAWVASGGAMSFTWETGKSMVNSFFSMASTSMTTKPNSAQESIGTGKAQMQGLEAIGDTIIQTNIARKLPADLKGNIKTSPLTSGEKIRVYNRLQTINSDQAKSIDDYFTMFGYKVNKLAIPNRHNRLHYTFIKTKGCKVHGNAPADAITRIQNMYNSGIRFWVNANEIGDYTVTNTPLGN